MINIGFDFDRGRRFNPLRYMDEMNAIKSDVEKCEDDAVFLCDNAYTAEMISLMCKKMKRSCCFMDKDGREMTEDAFFTIFARPFRELDLYRVEIDNVNSGN